MTKTYGLPAAALTGKPIGSVIEDAGLNVDEDALAQVRQRIASVFESGQSLEYELTWPTAAGRKYYNVRLFPEFDLAGSVMNVLGISRDITERKQSEEDLRATTEQLRALWGRLQSAREEEGIRIAREIHDELGSALTSLSWDLQRMYSDSENRSVPQLKKKIGDMSRLTDSLIDIVRRISAELRPSVLDVLGVIEAIEWQARQFQERTGIVVHCDSTPGIALDQEQATAAFRIFQEALTNILRHARATRVDVTMKEEDGAFVLTISDNGRGITKDEKSDLSSLGLLGMRERALLIGGEIDIAGVRGEGTTVAVRLPIVRAGRAVEAGS